MTAPEKLLESAGARAAPSTFSVPAWFTESGAGRPGDAERVSGTRPTLVFYRPGWEATGPSPLICTFKELSGSCQRNPQTRRSPPPQLLQDLHPRPRPHPAPLGSWPACPLKLFAVIYFPEALGQTIVLPSVVLPTVGGGTSGSCLPPRAACVAGEGSASGGAFSGEPLGGGGGGRGGAGG